MLAIETYFNIFDCIPICMSCWNVKCTWTVLLMLVCETMHFSINPFCTRLALAVFIDLWKVSAFSPYFIKQIHWASKLKINSLVRKPCSSVVHKLAWEEPTHPTGDTSRGPNTRSFIYKRLRTGSIDLTVRGARGFWWCFSGGVGVACFVFSKTNLALT